MPERLQFLTAGDAAVSPGLAGLVGSILSAVPRNSPFTITLVDGGLSPGLKAELARAVAARPSAEIRFIPFNWPASRKAPPLEGSQLAYARLFATEWIASPFCLYLDADTILREDPTELFQLAQRHPEVPLWAARNYPSGGYHEQLGRQSPELIRDVPPDAVYFNSGVLLINLDAWRRRDVAGHCVDLAERYQFIAHDQDALNVCFRGEWRELPGRWNYQLFERHVFPSDAALLHYSGRNKPWHCGYPGRTRAPYLRALAEVGWDSWSPPVNLKQWLRNSPFRPVLSRAQYWVRRSFGGNGIKRR